MLKHNKKLYEVLSVGGLSAFLIFGLTGCEDNCTNKSKDECKEKQHSHSTFIPINTTSMSSGYFSSGISSSSESLGG